MRKIIDSSRGAPVYGLWRWKCPETGLLITHSNFPGIKSAVKKYLVANNFPVTSQFEEQLEENLCENASPNTCTDFEPPTLAEKMSTLAMALWQLRKTWRDPLVSAEELQDRREYCTGNETRPRCEFYSGSTSLLKVACKRCGCAGLKLALKSSVCPIGNWT